MSRAPWVEVSELIFPRSRVGWVPMSIEELKREIKGLSGEERHQLSSFLTELELAEDVGYWARVRARVADEDRSSWVSVEDLPAS